MKKETNPYLKKELKHFIHTFNRQPLLIKKGKDSSVWDEKGKRYYDFFSGLAVCGVGHTNEKVVKAIRKQAGQILHTSNFFYTEPQMALAQALTAKKPGSKVFFSNSGAEANELAIKLARLWAEKNKKTGREIITFFNSFHGRTLATAAASGGMYRESNTVFKPLPTGFKSIPYNDVEKLRKTVSKKTIAVMLEPIQGEGGIHVATREFFREIVALSKKHKFLIIADEIQSGMGRTGTFFATEQYNVTPDIVTLAKGLAGGLPLGATLAVQNVAQHVVPGLHGSTFGGNPLSCAASLEVLKMLTPQALSSIKVLGKNIFQKLAAFARYPSVVSIRGKGLMMGIEINKSGAPFVSLARKKGLLINCTHNTVLRFLPPYFISKKDLKNCLSILESVFDELG